MAESTLPVAVGVDGSPAAMLAADWAAREAAEQRRPLSVVQVVAKLESMERLPDPMAGADRDAAAEQILRAVAKRVRETHGELKVETVLAHGAAAPELLRVAKQSAALVLGARGHGGFRGLLLGSVAEQAAAHAACPVVIVRAPVKAAADAPVVVGVDAAPRSHQALEYAFEVAARRAVTLRALLAYPPPITVPGHGATPGAVIESIRRAAQHRLQDALEPLRAKQPEVIVDAQVVAGPPAHSLVEASGQAQLVVVGSRGHGGFAGLLLGSVSRQVLHHAECPVAVVR